MGIYWEVSCKGRRCGLVVWCFVGDVLVGCCGDRGVFSVHVGVIAFLGDLSCVWMVGDDGVIGGCEDCLPGCE